MTSDGSRRFAPQPTVYRIYLEQCCHEELFQLYANEILMGARISGVEAAMVEYISRNIEPVGWKAVWRGTKRSSGLPVECDFLVEIFDVSLVKPQATINVLELLDCPGVEYARESAELELLLNSDATAEISVPIIELYPLSDSDEQESLFLQTAVTIEHVRCFYKYLWRPWDEDDDDDVFSEKYLSDRLKFFLDLKNKVIPESLVMQAETILQEGWKLHYEIDCITQDLQVSEFEQELDEDNIRKVINLRLKLEQLQKQMELMENPLMRSLSMTPDISLKVKNNGCHVGPVYHIVGENFCFGKISELHLNENDILEFHHNMENVIGCCSALDTVLIFPGTYKCGSLSWLENDVTIKGLGRNSSEVILEGLGGSGDFFVNCNTNLIQLENVTLHPSSDTLSTVIVHSGELMMKNCTIYGGSSCMILLPDSKAEVESCKFLTAKDCGIQLRVSSSLGLKGCKINNCKHAGILLNGSTNWTETDGCTKLSIKDSVLMPSECNGVVLECETNQDFLSEDITWNTVNKVPWLSVNVTSDCELGNIGLRYLDELKGSPLSPPNDYACFLESVEANHFRWSSEDLQGTVHTLTFEDSPSAESTLK